MTILDDLAEHAKERVANSKRHMSLDKVMRQALETPKGNFAFENALKEPDVAFICECKKASPSKGLIAPDFPYLNIAKEYEAAGADAMSVLTEPKWFMGKDEYLSIVRSLADEYGVAVGDGEDEISEEELMKRAEAFAIRRNGRSPRTARQFIELLKIGL